MKHKTTREYYEKYSQLCARVGLTLKGSLLPQFQRPFLEEAYKKDKALNTIPMRIFDAFYPFMLHHIPTLSYAENVCMYKHLLLHEVLGFEPEFCTYAKVDGRLILVPEGTQ